MKNSRTNVLRLINNLASYADNDISKMKGISKSIPSAVIRVNAMGEALEYFIKDAFCNSFGIRNGTLKMTEYSRQFSFLGNQNNPPDIMIREGDAIEVKKREGVRTGEIALNSSYPKAKLYSTSPMITSACRECEEWNIKDIVYAIGFVDRQKLRVLVLIYGDCYAASKEVYERIHDRITKGLQSLDLELSETKELGRVNKVDPLGITSLRVRGMWQIKDPVYLYPDLMKYSLNDKLTVFALMRKKKFYSFEEKDRKLVKNLQGGTIKNVKIQNPDNPAKLADAVLLKLVIP